jgi:hypothetical protein
MFSGSLVTKVWHFLRLQMEETAFSYAVDSRKRVVIQLRGSEWD